MSHKSNSVSIHPYFKVHPGKLETFKAAFPAFIEKTAEEKACLYYGFTSSGNIVHCREAYTDAEGLLAHLANVTELLDEALKISDLHRLEIHGPAAELEKLREPLQGLDPDWFVYEQGLQ